MIEHNERFRVITVTGLVLLVLILLVALSYPFTGTVKMRLASFFRKPLSLASFIAGGAAPGSPSEILDREKEELEEKLRVISAEFEEISRENERLRELLELKRRSEKRMVASRVIGRDISNWSKTILIEGGARDGIEKGMVVVSGSGALAGRVIESGQGMSKVILLNDPESRVGCLIQENRQTGILQGMAGGKILMRYIDSAAEIKKDQTVVTSGFGGTYPKGLTVGKIKGVRPGGSGLYLDALVFPEVDYSGLEEVLVVVE